MDPEKGFAALKSWRRATVFVSLVAFKITLLLSKISIYVSSLRDNGCLISIFIFSTEIKDNISILAWLAWHHSAESDKLICILWEYELFLNKMKLEIVSIFLILLNVTIYFIDGRGSENRRGRPKFPMVRKMLRGSSEVNSNVRYKEQKDHRKYYKFVL